MKNNQDHLDAEFPGNGRNHGRGRGRPGRGRRWMGEYSLMDRRLVEPALLTFLAREDLHGYALLEKLVPLGLGSVNPSVIYRILRNYEEIGLVRSDWDAEDTQGPPRRVYAITDEGRLTLARAKHSLRETVDRIETLLKIMETE